MDERGSLTPNDLRNQVFNQKMRGYDPLEVNSVLEEVAARWEQLLSENLHLHEKDSAREEQLKKYTNLEQTLRDTLIVARKAAEDELETAKKEANLVIEQARLKAEKIIKEAESRGEDHQRQVLQLRDIKNRLKMEMEALLHSYAEQLKRIDKASDAGPGGTDNMVQAEPSISSTGNSISRLDAPEPQAVSTHTEEQENRPYSHPVITQEVHDETPDDFDAALNKIFGGESAEEEPKRDDSDAEHGAKSDN